MNKKSATLVLLPIEKQLVAKVYALFRSSSLSFS